MNMGLDMFLVKHTYIYGDGHRNLSLDYPGVKPERVKVIQEELGYWRKANAIHQWFVDNVQDGVDECQESYVTTEQLQQLLDIVKQVQADHALAPTLLPTESGFFFGSTEYDSYYFEDLEDTRRILEGAVTEEGITDIFYNSSW
jgi:hypothetical protein